MTREQITSTEGMTAKAIAEALEGGQLGDYLVTPKRGKVTTPSGDADQGARGSRADSPTAGKSAEEIASMLEDGSLDSYLSEPSRRRRSKS